uniref:non-specific serine/threonine protein kinase n=1 Tax=Oryza glumipatula TaxID=40148 RepID=A0A0D9YST4_9ORYZ
MTSECHMGDRAVVWLVAAVKGDRSERMEFIGNHSHKIQLPCQSNLGRKQKTGAFAPLGFHGRDMKWLPEGNTRFYPSDTWSEVRMKLSEALQSNGRDATSDGSDSELKNNRKNYPLNGIKWLQISTTLIDGLIEPTFMKWIQEEKAWENSKINEELMKTVTSKIKEDDRILKRFNRLGKSELYLDLLYFLRFGSARSYSYFDAKFLAEHGARILEDLVIFLADAVASIYIELISVDGDMPTDVVGSSLALCSLSTRELQRMRNEVAINGWLHQYFESVVSMYEDRFELYVLSRKLCEKPADNQAEVTNWWRLGFGKPSTVTLLEYVHISSFSLPVRRTKELRALAGWRYYFSLLLEMSDIAMPFIRAVVTKVSAAVSYFWVSMIGRIPAYIGKPCSVACQFLTEILTKKPNHILRANKASSFRMNFFHLALVLLPLSFICPPVGSCIEQERLTLLRFLAELSPPHDNGLAASWRNRTDCCTWEGIICDVDGAVTEILLASRGLEGRISSSLSELTSLSRLNLSYNSLSGGLPPELIFSGSIVVLDVSFNCLGGELQEVDSSSSDWPLQVLNISSNLFTGAFPSTTWEKMSNLVAINASNNSFTGHIPSSFCISSLSFAALDLCYNQFSGEIPAGIGKCSALRMLKAGHNNITGALPDDLFHATSLEYLSFPNNGLQGTIKLVIKLSNLASSRNWRSFAWTITTYLGSCHLANCTNLAAIVLVSNKFTGDLAKVNFSNLPNLKTLDLCTNYFTGTIPASIYSCSNLTWLRLSFNKLHGQLPEETEKLKSLTFVSLSYNYFTNITGALHILKSLRNLTTLLIGGNFMHETIPQDETIHGLENLQVLGINHCALTGKIPSWLSKLKKLELLLLYNNQLSGPIPTWIKSLNYLKYVDLSNNSLIGEIPTSLTEMPMLRSDKIADHSNPRLFRMPVFVAPSLQYHTANAFPKMLNLGNNKFSGVIPMEIGQLKALLSLNLSFNNLHGEIPQSASNLKNLMVLDLSSNHLTGAIPSSLANLHFLSNFNISYNDLEGPVPIIGQFSTFPISSFAGNPKLCSPMLLHRCNSAGAAPVSTIPTKQYIDKVVFAIAFGMFFGVGVLYDQIVVSRFFG